MNTAEAAWLWKAIHPRTLNDLSHPAVSAKALAEPAFLKSTKSWQFLIEYSERVHAGAPLAAVIERSAWQHEIPEAPRRLFERRLRRERMRLALLDDEFDFTFEELSRAGIPCIVMKGMELGRRYYPSRIFRPMTKIDLLVKPGNFERAIEILRKAGFQVIGDFPKGRFRIELGRFAADISEGPVVELHKYLQEGDTDSSIEAVWERAERGRIPGLPSSALSLAPEDLLPCLIRHAGVQHLVESPVWLNDLHLVASSPCFHGRDGQSGAGCSLAFESVVRSKAIPAAYFLMTFLNRYYGTGFPEGCVAAFEAKLRPLQARMLSKRAKPSALFPPNGRSLAWTATTRLLLRDSPMEAFSYAVRRIKSL